MIKNCRSRLNWSGWQICSVDVTNSTTAPFDFVPLFLHLVLSLLTVVDFLAIALSSAVNRRFSIGFSSGFRVCHFIISGLTAARKCFPSSAEWLRSIVLHKYCWLIRRWCQGGNNLCWRSFIGTLAFTLLRGCVRGSNFAAENIHQTINLPPPNLTGFFTLVWVHLFSSFSAEHDACCVNLLLYQFLVSTWSVPLQISVYAFDFSCFMIGLVPAGFQSDFCIPRKDLTPFQPRIGISVESNLY